MAAALLAATVPVAPAGGRPLNIPHEQVVALLRHVAITPLSVPDDLMVDAVDRAALVELVATELRGAGAEVVPPGETGPALTAAAGANGARADPAAGGVDDERWKATLRDAERSLRGGRGVDCLLLVGLRTSQAAVANGLARWNGAAEDPLTGAARAFQGRRPRMLGLSVAVWLYGPEGDLLYWRRGGLRLLYKLGAGGQVVPVADADLLADPVRNARAVGLALGPLLERPAGAGSAP